MIYGIPGLMGSVNWASDPIVAAVNSYRQQANFARRVRPMVDSIGATFLDTYPATRHAVTQRTPHAVRFDHRSTFHYHDAGRYLQAQLLLHTLRLLFARVEGGETRELGKH